MNDKEKLLCDCLLTLCLNIQQERSKNYDMFHYEFSDFDEFCSFTLKNEKEGNNFPFSFNIKGVDAILNIAYDKNDNRKIII